jgi:hypothetical protein
MTKTADNWTKIGIIAAQIAARLRLRREGIGKAAAARPWGQGSGVVKPPRVGCECAACGERASG